MGKVLHCFLYDVTIMKMLAEAYHWLASIMCKEKSFKGLIFVNWNNNINQDANITGVVTTGGTNDWCDGNHPHDLQL